METIQISKDSAIRALEIADTTNTKEVLKALFGDLKPRPIREQVKDFDDILRIGGKTMADMEKEGDTDDEVAYRQAKLIAFVYNGGKVPDAMNTDEYKYYPYHKIDPGSVVGLSYCGCVSWDSYSDVGVRLCFLDPNDAVDAGKKFVDIYARLKIK